MTDDDKTISNVFSLLGAGPAAKELYGDLLKPACREMGANLLTVAKSVTVALAPIRGAIWGWEKIETWLSLTLTKKFAERHIENISTPPLNIAGPVLMQLPFCEHEEQLRDMYANLLVTSMNENASNSAHPAFVYVIQQLSPDEAIVLRHIAINHLDDEPLLSETESTTVYAGDNQIDPQFREICENATLKQPENSGAYLDNLLRLKILTEKYWGEVAFEPEYSHRHGIEAASVNRFDTKEICITEFGHRFIEVCVQ